MEEEDKIEADDGLMEDEEEEVYRDPNTGPLRKLTIHLVSTYKKVSQIYKQDQLNQTRVKSEYDDDNGDYILRRGEVINNRFTVESVLGRGSFGIVAKGRDALRQEAVAIKIIKNSIPFYNQAQVELRILRMLRDNDPEDKYCIVKVLDMFVYRDHQCIVFELLSHNLYEVIRSTAFKGLSLNLISKFAQQILFSLNYLSRMNIIHCDLKPENIMLRNIQYCNLKIIDFGSSCFSNQKPFKYIQSRYYRSPEVLLELNYDTSIDMWGLGCILVELHTGAPLFAGDNELDQMEKICQVLGLPPDYMINFSQKRDKYFALGSDNRYSLRSKLAKKELFDIVKQPQPLRYNPDCADHVRHTDMHYIHFYDLISRMLTYDPSNRIKPVEALQHPFFQSQNDQFLYVQQLQNNSNSASPTTSSPQSPRSPMENTPRPPTKPKKKKNRMSLPSSNREKEEPTKKRLRTCSNAPSVRRESRMHMDSDDDS
eukprot:TRINITY_DN8091_c0_g1_i1.p1 TRINITY_DN8091_c0_g1~~TRINITY_DN8091_c0_g1_i1.p1  ORF type:complete len:483 (-),score=68.87 TRINITY_DN8091_c0_g1_i1:85-1533(-)